MEPTLEYRQYSLFAGDVLVRLLDVRHVAAEPAESLHVTIVALGVACVACGVPWRACGTRVGSEGATRKRGFRKESVSCNSYNHACVLSL